MVEQRTKAEPKREGKFVENVKNKTERMGELQERLVVLRDILEPYSVKPSTENEGQTGQACETDMNQALYGLSKGIDKTEDKINKLIDNFKG